MPQSLQDHGQVEVGIGELRMHLDCLLIAEDAAPVPPGLPELVRDAVAAAFKKPYPGTRCRRPCPPALRPALRIFCPVPSRRGWLRRCHAQTGRPDLPDHLGHVAAHRRGQHLHGLEDAVGVDEEAGRGCPRRWPHRKRRRVRPPGRRCRSAWDRAALREPSWTTHLPATPCG